MTNGLHGRPSHEDDDQEGCPILPDFEPPTIALAPEIRSRKRRKFVKISEVCFELPLMSFCSVSSKSYAHQMDLNPFAHERTLAGIRWCCMGSFLPALAPRTCLQGSAELDILSLQA